MISVILYLLAESVASDSAEDKLVLDALSDVLRTASDKSLADAANVLMSQFPDGPSTITLVDIVAAVVAAEIHDLGLNPFSVLAEAEAAVPAGV